MVNSFYRDEDWWDNDGALNTISMTHPRLPVEHPHHLVVKDSDCHPLQPGVWFVLFLPPHLCVLLMFVNYLIHEKNACFASRKWLYLNNACFLELFWSRHTWLLSAGITRLWKAITSSSLWIEREPGFSLIWYTTASSNDAESTRSERSRRCQTIWINSSQCKISLTPFHCRRWKKKMVEHHEIILDSFFIFFSLFYLFFFLPFSLD